MPDDSLRATARRLGVAYSTLQERATKLGRDAAIESFAEPLMRADEIQIVVREYDEERHLVYPLGDVHLGAESHDPEKWARWLGYLYERSNASLLGTGDFLNTAIIGSKSDVYSEKMTVGQAKRLLRRQLEQVNGRIDAMLPGNHEDRITKQTGDCPIHDVAEGLNAPYVPAAAVLIYLIGDQEYQLYVRHGSGTGQSLAQLAKGGQVVHADIYVTGHTHRQAVTADDYFVVKGQELQRHKRYFVSSGSFVGYEKYMAQRGYPPARLGAPRIELSGTKWDVHISI